MLLLVAVLATAALANDQCGDACQGTMKAAIIHEFGDPSVLKIEHIPIPSPSKGQVLVKVESIGINPYEVYIRQGHFPSAPPPLVLGHDGAGVVAAVGEGVTSVAVGDRVFISAAVTGTYAQYTIAAESAVHHLPAHVSFDQGAAVNVPYLTAYHSLFPIGKVKAGQVVLVNGGSGACGIATIQFARSLGLKVIATAGSKHGLELVKSVGAHVALNHNDAGFLDKAVEAAGPSGIDVIVEMAAHANLAGDVNAVASHGTIVVVGSRGAATFDPYPLLFKSVSIKGLTVVSLTPAELKEAFSAIVAGLEQGFLKPVIGESYALEAVADAHVQVIEHQGGSSGKIVVHPWP